MSQNKDTKILLVVEDDLGLQKQLKWCFEQYQLVFAEDEASAIKQLRRFEPEVVTLDLGLPPDPANASVGLGVLEQMLQLAPHTKVIVVTGNDDQSNAVRAVGMGAYDFYQKPMDPDVLSLVVDRAFKLSQLEQENRRLTEAAMPLDGLIAASDEMQSICRMVEKIAPADISALLLGESGTGKEVIAKAIHGLSERSNGRFVAINCASIPENLLESELFGYEKGAFTGAAKQTPGKIETANGGTLFLDEIGDMPLSLQAKLLRFLQEKTVERIGGRQEIAVDVRILSATHQNLEQMIIDGGFREDLFYRLSEFTINIPPLRERPGDAIVIARALLDRYTKAQGRQLRGFTDNACQAITAFKWPGNIRELENKVKRAVIMADGHQVTELDLGLMAPKAAEDMPLNLKQARDEAERRVVLMALSQAESNISKASELLGVTRPTLYALIDKLNLAVREQQEKTL